MVLFLVLLKLISLARSLQEHRNISIIVVNSRTEKNLLIFLGHVIIQNKERYILSIFSKNHILVGYSGKDIFILQLMNC